MNILLTEADYKDKYPPLGLMKISTYHKLKGDLVEYSREYKSKGKSYYDKIYISTRFSFHWSKTKKLIKHYQNNFNSEIIVGGIHASINPDIYKNEFGIDPIVGSFKGDVGSLMKKIQEDKILLKLRDEIEKYGIDALPPDYSLFFSQELPFNEALRDNYLLRSTKGCDRNCSFCDVKKICQEYIEYLKILPVIEYIDYHFGQKKNILFFDDNTLKSSLINNIVEDLIKAGFNKDASFGRKKRTCDFNQGLDLRLLDDKKLQLLSSINIYPLRFAFDDIRIKKNFIKKVQKVVNYGIKNIAVYVLYNYEDTPEDFYERLRISIDINEAHNARIMSFPMKYVPNDQTNRSFLGKYWTKRMIRGVQCILNGCHGIVPVKFSFFKTAFGDNFPEFFKIIQMPENYIIYRKKNELKIAHWNEDYHLLTEEERLIAIDSISMGKNKIMYPAQRNERIMNFLGHYENESIL